MNAMNADVMNALYGMNLREIVFIDSSYRVNARGEFLDPWGHPYRIDVSNPQSPNVYSFGENGIDEGGAEGSDDIAS